MEELKALGIYNTKNVYRNLSAARLTEHALKNGEGTLTATGAISTFSGKYTGRSPKDRFIADEPDIHDKIEWGKVNMPISEDKFERIHGKLIAYLQNKDLYVFDGFAGADKDYRLSVRVVNEYAYQNLFINNLLIVPAEDELENFSPEFNVICAPGFKCDPELDGTHSEAAILISFTKKLVLIAGSKYCGEIKKSIFSVMNYLLPEQDVFPMHCSANMGDDGDTAIFFGLSGTGKTTLSADPARKLIGDDEHGWSKNGVFNFEGGCFAKCINLSEETEPEIWNAIKFGSVVENVVYDEKGNPDYTDNTYTENTRVGYPLHYINNALIPSVGGQPKTVIFLTADAFGVLPPIARLDKNQAMYQFVSGYTSKLAGTERGIVEPEATFSTCFAAPFLPLAASRYAELLGKRIEEYGCNVYLINTGWSGGGYGVGKRMSLKYTRAMVTAALNGELENVDFERDPIFNVDIPKTCPNVPDEVLNPKNVWADKAAYEKNAKELAKRFIDNFKQYKNMPAAIVEAGPKA